MSYDVTIAADDEFSVSVPARPLQQFISQLPRVIPNGDRSFALREDDRVWMEIDLEDVTEDGDIRDDSDDSPNVNCVRFHIPYALLGDHPERDYFPTVLAIAQHVGWPAIDDQTGEPLAASPSQEVGFPPRKPWWKFW